MERVQLLLLWDDRVYIYYLKKADTARVTWLQEALDMIERASRHTVYPGSQIPDKTNGHEIYVIEKATHPHIAALWRLLRLPVGAVNNRNIFEDNLASAGYTLKDPKDFSSSLEPIPDAKVKVEVRLATPKERESETIVRIYCIRI